jgi:hypothetical protein
VWSGTKVWPSNETAAPSLDRTVRSTDGLNVIDLAALVQMKLVADRHHDRAHIVDLLHAGLITDAIRESLPEALRQRLSAIEAQSPPDLLED